MTKHGLLRLSALVVFITACAGPMRSSTPTEVVLPVAAPSSAPPSPTASAPVASPPPRATSSPAATKLYRSRISAWVAAGFRVTGTGLPPETLSRPVRAVIRLGARREVTSSTIEPSGVPEIDAAVMRHLQSLEGRTTPPPPEDYIEGAPDELHVIFVCGRSCN